MEYHKLITLQVKFSTVFCINCHLGIVTDYRGAV